MDDPIFDIEIISEYLYTCLTASGSNTVADK